MDIPARKRFDQETVSSGQENQNSLLGEAFKFHRKNKNMTQEEVAQKSGIDASDISRLENGLINPTYKQMRRLAEALGVLYSQIVTMEEILAGRVEPEQGA